MLTQNTAPTVPTVELLSDTRRDLLRTAHLALAGELVGAITHDLRQPLTALNVNVDVAIQLLRTRPTDVNAAIAALQDAVDDSRQLRDSLKVLHNLVTRRDPARGQVAVADVLTEVVRLVQSEANTRHVEIAVAVAPNIPLLPGDPSMIWQAILSMVLDAVENAARGGVVRAQLAITDRGALELTVTHARREDSPIEDGWALAVARWVSEAHGASLKIERTSSGEVRVKTLWPEVAPARFERHVM